MRFYRKGEPSSGCCWFTTYEEAINWDGNDEDEIAKITALPGESNTFFKPNGVGYQLSSEGFKYFEKRIEKFSINEFLEKCDDPKIGRFM